MKNEPIKPMLARLIKEPFDGKDWLFEIKFDGYRAIANVDKKNIQFYSRNNLSFEEKFKPVFDELKTIKQQVCLDGEVVVLDEKGRSGFQLIQNYLTKKQGKLAYYVFDILFLEGKDLRHLPLIKRKEVLKAFLKANSFKTIHYSDHVNEKGKAFFKSAEKNGLEGIMAKRASSKYTSQRSQDWLKIKTHRQQEALIAGFTEPKGSRKFFGALLLGLYDKNHELKFCGHTGSGFNQEHLKEIYEKLKPLVQKKSPFNIIPKTNTPAVWVKPKLVAEISFAEWTSDGIMRQPIFKGLRMDKKTSLVKKEKQIGLSAEKKEKFLFTKTNKIYWPKEKLTKGDLINYYKAVTSSILPYLKNRPLMMKRFPEGIEHGSFIQKDVHGLNLPTGIKTERIVHEEKDLTYLLVQNEKTLDYVINLGTIELHPFLSQIKTPEKPDYFVIDLDPEDVKFEIVVETAQVIHQILDSFNITHVIKTSGKRGLHICLPLGRKYTFDQALQFGQLLAHYIHEELPDITSLLRKPSERQKRIYIDVLQNHYKQTVIAPYSARGVEGATVSAPLKWSEVKKGLDPYDFTIKNFEKRLNKVGDLFAPALGKAINILQILKKFPKE